MTLKSYYQSIFTKFIVRSLPLKIIVIVAKINSIGFRLSK